MCRISAAKSEMFPQTALPFFLRTYLRMFNCSLNCSISVLEVFGAQAKMHFWMLGSSTQMLKLALLYKIVHGMCYFPPDILCPRTNYSVRTNHSLVKMAKSVREALKKDGGEYIPSTPMQLVAGLLDGRPDIRFL